MNRLLNQLLSNAAGLLLTGWLVYWGIVSNDPSAAVLIVLSVVGMIFNWLLSRPRRQFVILTATAGCDQDLNFHPDIYYRLVKRHGWRNIKLSVDEAIEIPNAEIIPVQLVVRDGFYVFFQYKDRWFWGTHHCP